MSTDKPGPRPILETFSRLRGGAALNEMAEELQKVVGAVLQTQRKGTLKIVLTVDPVKNAPSAVFIHAEVEGKAPELAKATDVFFADRDNNLHINNQTQRDMFAQGPRPVVA